MSNNSNPSGGGGFKKEIGVFGGMSIIGGIMIGSGIFYLESYVLERTEMSMGLALICWIVGGLVSILGGLCFAELGACDTKAGGMVVYMNRAYHPSVGYSFGSRARSSAVRVPLRPLQSHFRRLLQSFSISAIWALKS